MKEESKKLFFERLEAIDPNLPTLLQNKKTKFSFRLNRLKSDDGVREWIEKNVLSAKRCDWFDDAYVAEIDDRDRLIKSEIYTSNRVYVQNLSSMAAVLELEAEEGEWVLDMASAPGGKALMLSSILGDRVKISAVEKDKKRFFMLKRNIKAHGAKSIRTYLKDARWIFKSCPAYFDRVLLDAPCSSESKFDLSKEPAIGYWSLRRVYRNSRLQKELILSAWNSLKPGGLMVYSTCTFSPEENEEVVDYLLQRTDATLEESSLRLENFTPALIAFENRRYDPEVKKCVRILPGKGFDGFFIAKIRKPL